MRFLIGIVTGAILTMLIATAVDAPTHPVLDRAKDTATRAWDGLIDNTSDTLFGSEKPVALPVSIGSAREPAARLQEPEELPGAPPASAPAAPAPAARKQEPPAAARGDVPQETGLEADPEETPALAMMPQPDVPAAPRPMTPYDAGDPLVASVWTPFHSQMSAEGFAARLSRQLDHDFRVERRAAGAYQVVFDAGTGDERDLLLTQIREITGAEVPSR